MAVVPSAEYKDNMVFNAANRRQRPWSYGFLVSGMGFVGWRCEEARHANDVQCSCQWNHYLRMTFHPVPALSELVL
jgi:hypothetical protein